MTIKFSRRMNVSFMILLIIIALSACAERSEIAANVSVHGMGIEISGGEEGKSWVFENSKILQIMDDHITISGTVTKDLKIECAYASQLSIQDLDQGEHQIDLLAYEDFTLNIVGKNELASVKGLESVKIRGDRGNAKVLLQECSAGKDLDMYNAEVCAESFTAYRDMKISGASIVTAKKLSDSSEDYSLISRIHAFRDISINLAAGGILRIGDAASIIPLSAEGKINLGKNNEILIPKNGEIIDDEESLEGALIYDGEGEEAEDVEIRNTSKK